MREKNVFGNVLENRLLKVKKEKIYRENKYLKSAFATFESQSENSECTVCRRHQTGSRRVALCDDRSTCEVKKPGQLTCSRKMKARMAAANSARKMRRMSMKNCKTKKERKKKQWARNRVRDRDKLPRWCQRKCTSVTKIHSVFARLALSINYAWVQWQTERHLASTGCPVSAHTVTCAHAV